MPFAKINGQTRLLNSGRWS